MDAIRRQRTEIRPPESSSQQSATRSTWAEAGPGARAALGKVAHDLCAGFAGQRNYDGMKRAFAAVEKCMKRWVLPKRTEADDEFDQRSEPLENKDAVLDGIVQYIRSFKAK